MFVEVFLIVNNQLFDLNMRASTRVCQLDPHKNVAFGGSLLVYCPIIATFFPLFE